MVDAPCKLTPDDYRPGFFFEVASVMVALLLALVLTNAESRAAAVYLPIPELMEGVIAITSPEEP